MNQEDHLRVLFKAILDNMTDNIVLIDKNHKVISFNDVIKNTLKLFFNKDLALGDDYRDFVVEPLQEVYLEAFEKAVNGETYITQRATPVSELPGDAIWFEYKMNPVYDEQNVLLGVSLTATNIDLRKRKELELEKSYELIAQKTELVERSEKYFRTLIETSLDAIVLLDSEGKVIYQTPSVEKIIGYAPAELQAMNGIELIHPEDRISDGVDFLDLLAKPGSSFHKKHRLKKKNGNYVWIEGTYRNMLHDENVNAIVFNYSDVTDRETAVYNLQERIKELSTIYLVNSVLQNEDQSVEEVFTKITGLLPPGWQYPQICAGRILFDGREYKTHNYQPTPFSQKSQFTLQDGRQGMVEIVYLEEREMMDEGPFLNEERALLDAISATITVYFNKRIHQKELIRSEANLRSVFNSSEVGYLLLDKHFKIVSFNNKMKLGYAREIGFVLEQGLNVLELLPEERAITAKSVFYRVIEGAKPLEFEARYDRSGTVNHYTINTSPVIDRGEVIGLCLTAHDITKLKTLELERQNTIKDLIIRNKALEEFAQIVAHNVRGPLSSILGLSAILTEDLSGDDFKAALTGINGSAEKLDVVIVEMMNILKLKKEVNEPWEKINLALLVEEIKQNIIQQINSDNVVVECHFEQAAELTTIRSYLYTILHQLITNSIKYKQTDTPPKIQLTSSVSNNIVEITVQDNGIGIDLNKYRNKLFELNRRFTSKAEGNGLGLYTVKTLVEMLDGTIDVKSEMGEGTRFTIRLKAS